MVYTISIVDLARPGPVPQNSYYLAMANVLETIISFLVQCFFGFRVYRLSRQFSLGLACWALAATRFVLAICVAVESFVDVPRVPNGVELVLKFGWLITLAFGLGALVDVVIALLQVWYLRGAVKSLQDTRCVVIQPVVMYVFDDDRTQKGACDSRECDELVSPYVIICTPDYTSDWN